MRPRYELKRLLGRGGMAEVYEATQRGEGDFSRRVAVKRLLGDVATDESFRRSFFDEAKIASCLHHASIVAVHDYGVLDGQPFQVLDLVLGVDLAILMRAVHAAGQTIPEPVALYVCREVSRALHYAHTLTIEGRPLGIVHRDVKPSNVLVSAEGDIKLGDFGIAFAHERTGHTQTGMVKGTMAYMAPEQLMGGRVDGRVDVFAVGCMLHALLTGRSPLVDTAVAAALVAGGAMPLDPQLPPDVAEVIARATQGRASSRYATAGELADALTDLLARRTLPDGKQALSTLVKRHAAPAEPKPAAGAFDALLMPATPTSTGAAHSAPAPVTSTSAGAPTSTGAAHSAPARTPATTPLARPIAPSTPRPTAMTPTAPPSPALTPPTASAYRAPNPPPPHATATTPVSTSPAIVYVIAGGVAAALLLGGLAAATWFSVRQRGARTEDARGPTAEEPSNGRKARACTPRSIVRRPRAVIMNGAEGCSWANLQKVLAEDGEAATCELAEDDSKAILVSDFGFDVPAARIKGVVVRVRRKGSGAAVRDRSVELALNGSPEGQDLGDLRWTSEYFTASYGAPDELWTLDLTPRQVNDPGFAVSLVARGEPKSVAHVDAISVEVFYCPD